MKIVFRADDAGSSAGANRAIVDTVVRGCVRNISVMVPGPAFEEAVPMLRSLAGVDLGLHVTLNAEWDFPKWGPVLPGSSVPSLLDGDAFTQNPGVLDSRGFSLDEAVAEVAAQLRKARDAGLAIAYLDEHMGVGWARSLRDRLREFALSEGLVYAGDIARHVSLDEVFSLPGSLLDSDEIGVVVFHPGAGDDPVMAGFIHPGLEAGQIHRERVRDRQIAMDARLSGVESVTYSSVLAPA